MLNGKARGEGIYLAKEPDLSLYYSFRPMARWDIGSYVHALAVVAVLPGEGVSGVPGEDILTVQDSSKVEITHLFVSVQNDGGQARTPQMQRPQLYSNFLIPSPVIPSPVIPSPVIPMDLAPEGPIGTWNCSICTFYNTGRQGSSCAMCGKPRWFLDNMS